MKALRKGEAKKVVGAWVAVLTTAAVAAVVWAATSRQTAEAVEVRVFKDPACGCCRAWADHVRRAGFQVTAEDVDATRLHEIKKRFGIGQQLASCHTAIVNGYAIEGHVPADVIRRLLRERPPVAGLTVPGMPVGSPGMEGPYTEPYEVLAFDRAGKITVYERR